MSTSEDQERFFGVTEFEFHAMHEQAVGFARLMIQNGTDNIMPHLFVHYRDDKGESVCAVCAIARPFNEHAEKSAALSDIAETFYRERRPIRAAFLIAEAWMANNLPEGVQPRDAPDRRECVIIGGSDLRQKLSAVACIPVERWPDGKMTALLELPRPDEVRLSLIGHFFREFVTKVAVGGGCRLRGLNRNERSSIQTPDRISERRVFTPPDSRAGIRRVQPR